MIGPLERMRARAVFFFVLATYTATCTINASATGTLSNTATVSSGVTDPVPANNSATDTDTLTPQADIGITKTDGVTTAAPGVATWLRAPARPSTSWASPGKFREAGGDIRDV